MTKDIMDVKEVAEYLALSPTTIYRMLTAGEIPNVKVGGQYRFPKEVIDDWIAGKLEVPLGNKGIREKGKKTRVKSEKKLLKREEKRVKSKTIQKQNQELEKVVRVEDEIIGHLLAAQASGSREETDKAKALMLEQIDKLDMAYLAAKAKTARVLEEAVAVQNELIKEASR